MDRTEGSDRQAVLAGKDIVLEDNVITEEPEGGIIAQIDVSGTSMKTITVSDGKTAAEKVMITAENKHMPGDINGDGKQPNTRDVIMLLKHITGERVDAVKGALDTNGDGKVNTRDVINLLKYITGEAVELY